MLTLPTLVDNDEPDTPSLLLWTGAGITVVGYLTVMVGAWNYLWVASAWALALYSVGVIGGFLFSLSRVVESATDDPGTSVRYLPNTGLGQIADWLTKIIVGLTLVELGKIPPHVAALSSRIAASIGNSSTSQGLGFAMILFFPIMGFLGMYLSTRIYLNARIVRAEESQNKPVFQSPTIAALDNPQTSLKEPNRGVTEAVTSTATDAATVPLEKLSTGSDFASWARAQTVLGDFDQAIKGYDKAIESDPKDPKLRLDYAVALYSGNGAIETVVEQLEQGLRMVDKQKDPDLTSRLYQNLIEAYLYIPPPTGFTKAIEVGTELLGSQLPKRAIVYFYYACAFGQKYTYSKNQPSSDPAQMDEARKQVMIATRKALDLDPSLVDSFRRVSDPSHKEKSKIDNDLEAFIDDPEFRLLVWQN